VNDICVIDLLLGIGHSIVLTNIYPLISISVSDFGVLYINNLGDELLYSLHTTNTDFFGDIAVHVTLKSNGSSKFGNINSVLAEYLSSFIIYLDINLLDVGIKYSFSFSVNYTGEFILILIPNVSLD